jgi:RNA polymerase sigma factor (sigma-70 family)
MNATRFRTAARRLAAPRAAPAADADLLARFLDARDEAAFEALVARHLPAVRAVCRSVLRDPHDADDAAQATFLVLVRRAAAVRDRAALGAWLCRVAWRAANRLRGANVRRGQRHAGVDPDATPGRDATGSNDEAGAAVRDEVGRLPERYRLAVQACYLAGTPTADAARNLGWPRGTLLTRLAWARRRLRARLSARGVALSAALAAAGPGAAGRAFGLSYQLTRVAAAVLAGDPAVRGLASERVLSTTEGVVRTMIATKLKVVAGLVLAAVAVVGLGLGRMTAAGPGADPADARDRKPAAAGPAAPPLKNATPREPAAAAPEQEPLKGDPAPAAPGNDLVVRRPRGSYTKEVPGYGRATVTFTENRMHVAAAVSLDKVTVTVTADADYAMNRESMIYGIVTGVDVTGTGRGEEAAELALYGEMVNDMPFAFRVRVEDDAVVVKDIKAGPIGSPLEKLDGGKGDLAEIALLIGGKYKADPNPDRNPPPAPRPNPGGAGPKLRRAPAGVNTDGPFLPPAGVPGGVIGPVPGLPPGAALPSQAPY